MNIFGAHSRSCFQFVQQPWLNWRSDSITVCFDYTSLYPCLPENHSGNSAEHFDFSNHKSLKRLKLYKNTSSSRSEDIHDTDLIRASLLTIIPTLETVPSLDLLIISLGLWFNWKNIASVDWSPLADYLPSASSKFRNIELHISPAIPRNNISFDEIFMLLVRYDNLMTLVKDGVLSIKPGEVWFP